MTRPWPLLVGACAIVVLAVGLAGSSAQRPPSAGRAAAPTSTDPADGAVLVRAPGGVELSFTAAPPDGSADGAVSHHVVFTDGRELAGALKCSVGIPVAAGPGAAREPPTVDADAAAKAGAAGNAEAAAGSAHQHGVDPVSAALLAIDGVVALAVVVLLLRRPPPQPS